MVPKPQKGSKTKTEDQLLDQATTSLLSAIKQHARTKGKSVTAEKLRREGYSDRFIAKVEVA
jgi:hypothetical protein